METRGTDAAGFAYATRDGSEGYYKDHVVGSQLPLKLLPRRADTVILHTRMATHGTKFDNTNNHPVLSPDHSIRLVHNGVIYNHDDLRDILTSGHSLADVDTAVIPAALQEYGVDGFGVLGGYAAVAWLDTKTSNTLHLARPESSPVSIARLLDGSVVFASTDAILARALNRMDLKWIGNWPDTFTELRDGDYVTITDSELSQEADVDWYSDYHVSSVVSSAFHKRTSGADKSEGWDAYNSPSWMADRDAWERDDEPGYFDENGNWRDDDRILNYSVYGTATPLALTAGASLDDHFYAYDHMGDFIGYKTFEDFMNGLKWISGVNSENQLSGDGLVRWVNHFADVGEVLDDGELRSFVNNPLILEDFTMGADEIQYIRDGLHILKHVMA